MARPLNSSVSMRIFLALSVLALACSRERPPRDYQNNPPAMTHPVTSSSQSPTAKGMPGPAPEPNKGVEGKNITRKPTSPTATTGTLKDQAPASELGPPPANSQHATQTTSTAVTGTHLATPP
ncbi:MAG TPA: hypothetical protein VKL19_03995 [Thermoanaerobaculia bacterium]|nr:hypothetical protein [Thermoanaerobaculia bacterium]